MHCFETKTKLSFQAYLRDTHCYYARNMQTVIWTKRVNRFADASGPMFEDFGNVGVKHSCPILQPTMRLLLSPAARVQECSAFRCAVRVISGPSYMR